MASREEIFERAKKAIISFDASMAKEVAAQGLDEKINPIELLTKGFVCGINEVGDLFGRGSLFLPELIMAADVMQQVTEQLNTSLKTAEKMEKAGIVVVGTVQGDIHDIGKTIVVAMFKANGFEVHDVGRDVPVQRFIEEAQKVNADIIGTSALLTTTMPEQRALEETLKKAGLKCKYKTIVGGAPVTQRWADRIGADAYAQDAADGVKKAKQLLGLT
ncbi:MAG: B12-binding domain-containing protein [Deltaproteobacteria bacterium]|nr:B12-binding domain-containing protein [Deltaproteobacteria bacterium]